jgi:UDP-N-acetylglucosamine 2-epimerase (non-hydrolysing)
MVANQSLNQLLAKLIGALDRVIERHSPAAMVIQGDTTTALAGALSARFRAVPVIHIEAGLRTGDANNPFPEESNRRLISHISSLHLAPTRGNLAQLTREGIAESDIVLTGNPIVDAIHSLDDTAVASEGLRRTLEELGNYKIIAMTTHRRENIGTRLSGYLHTVKAFVEKHPDVALVIPVHPNPLVGECVRRILTEAERVRLIAPLSYMDFYCLLRAAWLVLSDSGGVQEEVISLGKPLLVLREKTERPEAIETGTARMARTPHDLAEELATAILADSWCTRIKSVANPFGDGYSGKRIAQAITEYLSDRSTNRIIEP